MRSKWTAVCLAVATAVSGGFACAQSQTAEKPEHGTVSWYLANPDERRAMAARCDDDPGRIGQTRECVNVKAAEARAFTNAPPLPTTGNRRF